MDKPSTPLRAIGAPGTKPRIIDVQQKYTAVEGEDFVFVLNQEMFKQVNL